MVLLVAGMVIIAACTPEAERAEPSPVPEPVSGGTLRFGVLGEPATLDPYAPGASDLTFALVAPVFPMLFTPTAEGTVVPDLAASLEVAGGTATVELERREWSNGKPITARDVVASIRRAVPPSGFAQVEDASARGPRRVEMQGDIEDWAATLAEGAFVLPRGRMVGGNVSGGPYRFARYRRSRDLVYRSNPDAEQRALLDRLEVSFVHGTDLLVRLLDAGKLDAAAIPLSVNLDDRLDEMGIAYARRRGSERIVLAFDTDPPTAEAIMHELDVANLVESFIRDDGRALSVGATRDGAVPESMSLAVPEGDELLVLMQRAIQLDLERSGIQVELIAAPVSVIYGAWAQRDGAADVRLVRAFAPVRDSRVWHLASVATLVAYDESVNGITSEPSLTGPLVRAGQWWIDPSL